MKRRDLKDILREVQGEGVKDPETIRQYICALGDRTLFSLMYGDRQRCSEEERYECWSHLEFVLLAYTYLSDLTEEEIARCMKRITLKDFLCLVDHLNDRDREPANDLEVRGLLRNDFGMEYMQEAALGFLLKLLLRAKGRGDTDVSNFCMIHANSMFGVTDENVSRDASVQKKEISYNKAEKFTKADKKKKKVETIIDYFYKIQDWVHLNDESWMLEEDISNKRVEFGCLREMLVVSMEDFGYRDKFSLPGVLMRCKIIYSNESP